MSTKVDPNKIDELAIEYKRLSSIIEDGETGINRELLRLISDTNAQYHESYVRANTREMELLLKEIRVMAASITEQLNAKSNVLKHAADRYRADEEKAKKVFKLKSNLSLAKNEPWLVLPPSVTPLKTNLSINPKIYSDDVKKLQQKLKDLGYDVEVDGYFGKQTLAAVNGYKNKYGLGNTGEIAGVVGNQTWLYLFGGLTKELKFDPNKYSAQIKMAQIRLKDKGYSVEVTGYFDGKTLKAMNKFKEDNNLGNTGKWKGVIGPQTWNVLFGTVALSSRVNGFTGVVTKSPEIVASKGTRINNKKEYTGPSNPKYNMKNTHKLFGDVYFAQIKNSKGSIIDDVEIDKKWVQLYIVPLDVPVPLRKKLGKNIDVHRQSIKNWEKVFELLQKEYKPGKTYADLIVTQDGTYVTRYIRGQRKNLSNHSFGTAIDINALIKEEVNYKVIDNTGNEKIIVKKIDINNLKHKYTEKQGRKVKTDYNIDLSINKHLKNYILYENVFKPAGFGWGMNYSERADGMHFEVITLFGNE
ncbi:MAG: peptidoglycan-binding protein [Clostridia bacterium]|nr:peptidoglycan-binding protein [Clostridia bacterium]